MSKRLLCFLVDDEDTDMPVLAQINVAYSNSQEVVVVSDALRDVIAEAMSPECRVYADGVAEDVMALLEARTWE